MSAVLMPEADVDAPPADDDGAAASTPAPAPAPADATAPRHAPRGRVTAGLVQVASALTILLVLAVGFAVYVFGLSGLSERRAQDDLRKNFEYSLSQALAPVGPVREGTAVAEIDIPRIGLDRAIVIEGTSARDLASGPGHRADSPLPGQAGVSVVYGRRTAFGAPFENLLRLRVGDTITAVTGQGTATYRVSSFGDTQHPAPANSDNRLVLVTADASTVPDSTVSVSADLVSTVRPSAGGLPLVPDDQKGLVAGVDSSLVTTLLWSQALLVLVVLATVAANRWTRSATYLALTPIAMAVLWNFYENLACLLPNLY